jgi:hypothetical protein
MMKKKPRKISYRNLPVLIKMKSVSILKIAFKNKEKNKKRKA